MSDPQKEIREAVGEVGREFVRAVESASGLARQAVEDLTRLAGDARPGRHRPGGPAGPAGPSPVELIRELGRLRDEGLVSPEEFAAKKAELLSRI